VGALYPTLCRLWTQDREAFLATTRSALRATTTVVMPVAVGCAAYPEVGVSIFSAESFGPAADNLRLLALYLGLVYFTMTLGCCISAAGLQKRWAVAQVGCVLISFAADPFLIPWFQRRFHNGGLGICVASVASEVLMLVAASWIAPKGILDRLVVRTLLSALLAGGAMAGLAYALRDVTVFLSIPLVVLAYLAVLFATGGSDRDQLRSLRQMLRKQ
jgi:O-antigen/teichoic acid export membrane protein